MWGVLGPPLPSFIGPHRVAGDKDDRIERIMCERVSERRAAEHFAWAGVVEEEWF
jgi:hypothetical protein